MCNSVHERMRNLGITTELLKSATGGARRLMVILLLGVCGSQLAVANPLERHMQRMLVADGEQWRTPNPGFDPEQGGPAAFGLAFELSPDRSHVTGRLTGIHDDGRQALYWSLLAFYNPVTEKVITRQIGWDGAHLFAEVPVQDGPVQIIDMIHYKADGTLAYSRHENRFESEDEHSSDVLEPDGKGGWQQVQSWQWERHHLAGKGASPGKPATPTQLAPALDKHAGFLLAGSGRWRAPNPAYASGGDMESAYEMAFRPGPHGQHIIGEIVSVYADGREQKDWSMYFTYNPVTQQVMQEQTGASGVYFLGELDKLDNGRHTQSGTVFLPNGQARSVRDEVEIIDASHYISHVFERAGDGSWQKKREWTWTLQPVGGKHD
ncbi:MAG: hypothetical protein HKM98_01090 [Gammaproteobacteria bacterium]|nr:hypothetical protein [Gammaproteobacteria bacterium]